MCRLPYPGDDDEGCGLRDTDSGGRLGSLLISRSSAPLVGRAIGSSLRTARRRNRNFDRN